MFTLITPLDTSLDVTSLVFPVILPELKEASGLDLESCLALLYTALVIVSNEFFWKLKAYDWLLETSLFN